MIAQAVSVSSSLADQRRVFESVTDKLGTIGERFPVVNGLLNAIRRKKSKVGRARGWWKGVGGG
jgi:Golgi SNAP receptor complex protein 1